MNINGEMIIMDDFELYILAQTIFEFCRVGKQAFGLCTNDEFIDYINEITIEHTIATHQGYGY